MEYPDLKDLAEVDNRALVFYEDVVRRDYKRIAARIRHRMGRNGHGWPDGRRDRRLTKWLPGLLCGPKKKAQPIADAVATHGIDGAAVLYGYHRYGRPWLPGWCRSGLLLLEERIERRRAYWTLEAIRSAISPQLGIAWYEAREQSSEDAIAKYQLDRVRNQTAQMRNGSLN